jgi:hypothetical protein
VIARSLCQFSSNSLYSLIPNKLTYCQGIKQFDLIANQFLKWRYELKFESETGKKSKLLGFSVVTTKDLGLLTFKVEKFMQGLHFKNSNYICEKLPI